MRVWFHALPSVCVYVFATFLAFHEACGERGTENKMKSKDGGSE